MQIFQKSVIQKHLANLEQSQLDDAFQRFKQNYNADKIQLIKTLKEEEYQDGFLRDIFVDVFGYTLKPDKNFNLVREFKNQTDGKKADGAILKNAKAIAVIELKSNKIKDLKSITQQAFNYKNNQPYCQYVITSNFQKLRFYIDYANEYEEFDLFNLDREAFSLLYLILNKDNLLHGLPLQLKDETKCHEENISAQFYKDYSQFKQDIFANLTKNNPQFAQLLLFKKSQKFLDRLLFVFFAEDTGLVPPNSIITEIENWEKLQELNAYDSLYNRLKKFFQHLNMGYQSSIYDIPAYNGGLFSTDKILDKLSIDDEVLKDNLLKLATYDFNTELDVNILGHIFEHSLNELEEITAKIEGRAKKNTKRKKDGIFYTPKYITQYIVENTLGTLCAEKRQELNLVEIEFDDSYRKGSLSAKGKKLFKALEAYKKWLLQLKILDPACGSGAFLNQALNFLIAEHQEIDNIIADLTNAMPKFYDTDKMILENNIFGVDINEESVEIAQLSLWLRTAKKGRKLSNLSRNIKCGNSLIDDVAVAGDKAFDWNKEFQKIMGNGGFDVIIGNPPYFNIETLGAKSPIAQAIQNSYPEIWQDKSDIIFYFIAKSIELTKNKIGFIVSNAFLFSNKAEKLRNYILENVSIEKITNFEQFMVFKDASITTSIIELCKSNTNTLAYSFKAKNYTEEDISKIINNVNNYFEVKLQKDGVFALIDKQVAMLNDKIDANYQKLHQFFEIGKGMETAADKIFSFKEFPRQFPKGFIKNRVTGKNIERYLINQTSDYLLYFEDVESFEGLPLSIQNHLLENRTFLENRADKKRRKTSKWWNYTFPIHKEYYHLDKIFCSRRAFNNTFVIDSNNQYLGFSNMTVIFDTNENFNIRYLLALLNSTTLNFRYKSIGKQTGGGSFEYFPNGVGKLPIPQISQERQQPFIDLVDNILATKQQIKDYQSLLNNAVKNDNFDREIKLKQAIHHFESKVIQTDKEIDKMVYELYGLTAEEIGIVES